MVSKGKAEVKFSIESMIPKQMPLSQLEPVQSSFSGMPGRRGAMNGPVSVSGKSFEDAIIMRPGLDISYEIKGLYDSFSAKVGIGDESNSDNSIEFVLSGDGKELWRSKSMKKVDSPQSVKVDITNIQSLVLHIDGTSSRRSRIQAAWIGAELSQ